MADFGFQGISALALDAKGRLAVPVRHREAIDGACQGRLTITLHLDGCLLVFPRPNWDALRPTLVDLPEQKRDLKRAMLGHATDVDMDSGGRLLIPPELRDAAGITKDVKLLGLASHFELWDVKVQADRAAKALEQGLAAAMQDLRY